MMLSKSPCQDSLTPIKAQARVGIELRRRVNTHEAGDLAKNSLVNDPLNPSIALEALQQHVCVIGSVE